MPIQDHAVLVGGALKRWFLAQTYDALVVGALWMIGLLILRVPWAPLWGILGFLLQYIPHLGPVLALIGPAIAAAVSGGWERMVYALMLYAGIVIVEGLVLQPMIMKRTARVPVWASILAPLVLGMLFSFWGVVAAAPLLAVIYAYRARARENTEKT